MDELERLRDVLLRFVSGVENQLDPALMSLMSDVVLDWSANLSLPEECSVDKLVEQTFFQWHFFFF